MEETERRRHRGTTRVGSKRQVTIPAEALRATGIEVGERLAVRADGLGRLLLEREADVLAGFEGTLTDTYEPDEVAGLRDEWDVEAAERFAREAKPTGQAEALKALTGIAPGISAFTPR